MSVAIARTCVSGTSGEPALTLDNLSVIYNNETVGLAIDRLAFCRGEFAVLLGSSGAGKSTLLRCLNGLVRPTRGSVLAEGIGELRRECDMQRHRRKTAMIFQQHQLIRTQSVLDNVLKGRLGFQTLVRSLLPASREDQMIALESLDRVGLMQKALERVSALSGGEQQRVGIARALVQRPAIILADEPVASLDPATAENVLSLLRNVCRQDGITAVVSLHQVRLAVRFADRIVGLKNGRVMFDGTPTFLSEDTIRSVYKHGDSVSPVSAHVRRPAASVTAAVTT